MPTYECFDREDPDTTFTIEQDSARDAAEECAGRIAAKHREDDYYEGTITTKRADNGVIRHYHVTVEYEPNVTSTRVPDAEIEEQSAVGGAS